MAAAHERARARGLVLPGYRTREEFEAAIARCAAALGPAVPPETPAPIPAPVPAPAIEVAEIPVVDVVLAPPAAAPIVARPVAAAAATAIETATEFRNWILARVPDPGSDMTFSNEDLSATYGEFCGETGCAASENYVRKALGRLPGVYKTQRDDRSTGKRVRTIQWSFRHTAATLKLVEEKAKTRLHLVVAA